MARRAEHHLQHRLGVLRALLGGSRRRRVREAAQVLHPPADAQPLRELRQLAVVRVVRRVRHPRRRCGAMRVAGAPQRASSKGASLQVFETKRKEKSHALGGRAPTGCACGAARGWKLRVALRLLSPVRAREIVAGGPPTSMGPVVSKV